MGGNFEPVGFQQGGFQGPFQQGGFQPGGFVDEKTIEHNELMNHYDHNDTLKGYDIVLSISTEAINTQFQYLWHKELKHTLPDPRGGGFPSINNFIAHDLWLFPPNLPADDGGKFIDEANPKNQQPSSAPSTYLKAHVGAPKIEFHPTKQRVATITVEFMRDENADGLDKDSILQYWVEGRPKRLALNEWKMSWEVEITQEVIDDPNTNLLQPALNPTKHIVMEERAISELHKHLVIHRQVMPTAAATATIPTVNPSHFTVAAIFCRITSSPQVPGSFKFTPPEGVQLVDSWARNAALTAIWMEFHRNLAAFDPRFPTPQNPFVLGYSITQKVPPITDLNPDLDDPSRTPTYFVPRECHLSTTVVPEDMYTSGTLNFCMFTGSPNPYASIDPRTESFDKTFFCDLSLYGGPGDGRSKRPSGHDGIMAFSKRVFYYNWLQESLLSKLLIYPENYTELLSDPKGEKASVNAKKTTRTWIGDDNQSARWTKEFEFQDIVLSAQGEFGIAKMASPSDLLFGANVGDGVRQKGDGRQVIEVKYSSDFQKHNSDRAQRSDLKRQLYIDIEVETTMEFGIRLHDSPMNKGKFIPWVHRFWLHSRYKIGYTITPGKGGVWSIQKDPARTNLPVENVPIEDLRIANGATPERWQKWDNTGCQLLTGTAQPTLDSLKSLTGSQGDFHGARLKGAIMQWFTAYAADLGKAGENLKASVAKAVIMPAGNVVDFNGLDANGGHVYTSVDFSTLRPELHNTPLGK